MGKSKGKRLKQAEAAGSKPTGRTHLLGFFAAGAVLTVFGAELTRVWRLGMLPQSRTEADAAAGDVSFQSPVGRALDGARVGDTVVVPTPKGERRLVVRSIA